MDWTTALSVPRLICIFSLVLYCFDTGTDINVAFDLYGRCNYRYFASVISFVILPGIIYGWFQYFKINKDERDWKDVLIYFVLCPIGFIPLSFFNLVQAVVKNGLNPNSTAPSKAEDKAKW